MKNIYRFDFDVQDWANGVGCNDTIVCAPVLPSEFNSALLQADGTPVPGTVLLAEQDNAPAALVYRVVAIAPKASEALPGLEPGSVVVVRNMAGFTTSARVRFFLFQPADILWAWRDGTIQVEALTLMATFLQGLGPWGLVAVLGKVLLECVRRLDAQSTAHKAELLEKDGLIAALQDARVVAERSRTDFMVTVTKEQTAFLTAFSPRHR